MKALLEGIEAKVGTIPEVKYFGENWGQLDTIHFPNYPVKYPCVLFDIQSVDFDDMGANRSKTPMNRQNGAIQVVIDVADKVANNPSGYAPTQQKENARFIHLVLEKLHEKLHGEVVANSFGKLIRKRQFKVEREDGIRHHRIIYTTTAFDC